MIRDTLRRALWTALIAWGTWMILRLLGAPPLAAAVGPTVVIVVSHYWSGALALARAHAEQVLPNTSDEGRRHLFSAVIEAAIETGIAAPRVYVSDTMRRWAFASGVSRYNPAVCVHADLLGEGYAEALGIALRSELWAARNRLPWHGTLWGTCLAFTLCMFLP